MHSQELSHLVRTFQDVLQREERCVGLRVGNHGLIPHYTGQLGIKVDASTQGMDRILPGDVSAVTGEEAVIGKSVHHRARPTNYTGVSGSWQEKSSSPVGLTVIRAACLPFSFRESVSRLSPVLGQSGGQKAQLDSREN